MKCGQTENELGNILVEPKGGTLSSAHALCNCLAAGQTEHLSFVSLVGQTRNAFSLKNGDKCGVMSYMFLLSR